MLNKLYFLIAFYSIIITLGCKNFYNNSNKPINIKILAFNDFHGNLITPALDPESSVKEQLGGIEALHHTVSSIKNKNPYTIVVSAGDLIGASPLLSSMLHDEPTMVAMDLLGLEFSAVGNHEFDHGIKELFRMQYGGCLPRNCKMQSEFKGAKFKYLAANVIDVKDKKPIFPAYQIKYFGKIPVAFIGVVTREVKSLVSPKLDEVEFLDEAQTINNLIPELKSKGVKAIVVLMHEGGEIKNGYKNVLKDEKSINECKDLNGPVVDITNKLDKAVDIVITGHTHHVYNCNINETLVTSALSYGRLLSEIDLKFDPITYKIVEKKAINKLIKADKRNKNIQSALIKKLSKLVNGKDKLIVGHAFSFLSSKPNESGESLLGNIIADSQLEATSLPTQGGAQIAFVNSLGIRQGIMPDKKGQIAYTQLYSSQPYANKLVVITLKGKEIKKLLEQQWISSKGEERSDSMILQVSKGFSYKWDSKKPIWDKVSTHSIKLHGKTIDPEKNYRITVNDFLVGGGDGFTILEKGINPKIGPKDIDATENYFKKYSPLKIEGPNRIERIN